MVLAAAFSPEHALQVAVLEFAVENQLTAIGCPLALPRSILMLPLLILERFDLSQPGIMSLFQVEKRHFVFLLQSQLLRNSLSWLNGY